MKLNISYLLQEMTLEEKAGLCSGQDFWFTKAVERLGLPRIMVTDGPHGLRKQADAADHLGINSSVQAICFPSGAALASSFDRNLMGQLGEHLGEEARAENVHTLLGPAINIKRSPLCGRNFEYLSEDPYLAGEMSASYVNGVQSKQVGVSVKHYAANNQEFNRMSVDTIVSERALREIYLAAFEKTVREAAPWTLMCAYNRINGTYCCENEWLLTKLLRDEWGYDGIVMTDWGAMNDRIKGLEAGLELEMPGTFGISDRKIVAAVKNCQLSMEVLNQSVERLLRWIDKGMMEQRPDSYDKEAHHEFARKASAESAVLLKNDAGLLPVRKSQKVVFIGSFAAKPRFQGGGSSHINTTRVTSALTSVEGVAYAQGWNMDGETASEQLQQEAVAAARNADVAVIFAGLPDSFESEGYDRKHLELPQCQNALIDAVCAVQPNTAVVLHAGSPMVLPWASKVRAILMMYLGGQAVGQAAADLLYGKVSPSGHLAETFPLRLQDTPCYLNFAKNKCSVVYDEGVFVGYRWYDSREMEVAYPFGHGLTYTDFALKDVQASGSFRQGGSVCVSATITNTGAIPAKQVVQLYVAPPKQGSIVRPVQELKEFEKVELAPGECKIVSFTLDDRSFAYYEESAARWQIESGNYTIRLGFSSRDIRQECILAVEGEPLPFQLTDATIVQDIIDAGKIDCMKEYLELFRIAFGGENPQSEDSAVNDDMLNAMIAGMPLHSMCNFCPLPDDYMEVIRNRLK